MWFPLHRRGIRDRVCRGRWPELVLAWPASGEGSHDVRSELLLRADVHRFFDAGLVGVNQDLRIKVSPKIRETWFNGKAYYRLNDQALTVVPDLVANRHRIPTA